MTLQILYLAHDLTDAAIRRRVLMLRQGGARVSVAGFQRAGNVLAGEENGKSSLAVAVAAALAAAGDGAELISAADMYFRPVDLDLPGTAPQGCAYGDVHSVFCVQFSDANEPALPARSRSAS